VPSSRCQRAAHTRYNALIPKKPGPKSELLEPFDGTFEQAIDRALSKKKPAGGWPKG
jgi:hypothetical protein